MAKIAFTTDLDKIKSLWLQVFTEDSDESVYYFYNNCKHKKCLGAFVEDQLVSMLFLIDCSYCGKKGAYIYAVCTLPEYRRKGISSSLIEYSKLLDYDFLWLIPANESLFNFYSGFGFEIKLYSEHSFANTVSFSETKEMIFDYLYDGSEFKYPKGMIYSKNEFPCGATGIQNNNCIK